MRHFDLTPLYRSTIGFDRLGSVARYARQLRRRHAELPALQHRARRRERVSHQHGGRRLRREDLTIEVKENTLSIRGEKQAEDEETTYLHRGIAGAQLRAQVPARRPRGGQGREPSRTACCTLISCASCPRR